MKFLLAVILFACANSVNFAQDDSIFGEFEKNKLKYKLEKFSEGEDASSGYDYLVYKDKAKIVKMREIWSATTARIYRVEDYFFDDGKLVALVKYTLAKKYYKTAQKGRNIPLKMVERLIFKDGKLTGWTENGQAVAATDKRWQEKEKEALEAGKSMLENYDWLKKSD